MINVLYPSYIYGTYVASCIFLIAILNARKLNFNGKHSKLETVWTQHVYLLQARPQDAEGRGRGVARASVCWSRDQKVWLL